MAILQNNDVISGKEGTVFATIDGRVHEFAEIVKIEARINLLKADVKAVGKRMKGSKVVGAEGVGSWTIHYHRPEMRDYVYNFVKNGVTPQIDVMITNADVTSRAGRQSVLLKNLVPDSALIAMLDGDTEDTLTDESDFTWDDLEILERFKTIE
ncbi:phage tail tube protein [Mesobacillus stamsii]|uniref:Phage portal protein n=1 Tax=Mesobacillus stamsii TaxID=225347 RepID=A0ABU0FS38_9BACI|nr:phage tail tube protein [Mesobacillus stamsii]MDQ0412726.1 hypothetical protein [Mesobacillus stamsii]